MGAGAAGVGLGGVAAGAVQPLGDDPRGGGLAGPADAGEHEGLGYPVGFERIFQGADHRLLTHEVSEGGRAVLPRQNLIARLAHTHPRIRRPPAVPQNLVIGGGEVQHGAPGGCVGFL